MPGKGRWGESYSYEDDGYSYDGYSYGETPEDHGYMVQGQGANMGSLLDYVDEGTHTEPDGLSDDSASELDIPIEREGYVKPPSEAVEPVLPPKPVPVTVIPVQIKKPVPKPTPKPTPKSTPKPTPTTTPKPPARRLPTYTLTKDTVALAERAWADRAASTVMVVGHVDAGKSTVIGHLLYKLGAVSIKAMRRHEREAAVLGKDSFRFAFVMDQDASERERGVTMDVGTFTVTGPGGRTVHLVDCPGHRDFMPKLVTRAVAPDHAVLIIDAKDGEFEAGWGASGQTRENIQLMRAFGVASLVVAVNKMDLVGWAKTRFEDIKAQMRSFLSDSGFREGSNLTFVPLSGLGGDNLLDSPTATDALWVKAGHRPLMTVIESQPLPTPDASKPLRAAVTDVGAGGTTVSVKILSGVIRSGDPLVVCPSGINLTVTGITRSAPDGPEDSEVAIQGDYADLSVNISSGDEHHVIPGTVVAHPGRQPPVTRQVRARIATFDLQTPLMVGSDVEFFCQGARVPAIIARVSATLRRSGQVRKANPRLLPANTPALVQLRFSRPIAMDGSGGTAGRFVLRKEGTSVAVGLVQGVRAGV